MPRGSSKLSAILRQHAAIIPTRLENIANNISAIKSGDADALEETINTSHQIRGAAATMGLPKVGLLAGEIEDLLSLLVRSPHEFEKAGGWSRLEKKLDEAQREAKSSHR